MHKLNVSMLISCFFLASCVIRAEQSLSFMDSSIDGFINHLITNEIDKRGFKMYYNRLQEKVSESDQPKKRATRQYLYQVALNNLEKKHKDWHEQIDLFFSDVRFTVDESFDKVRHSIRHFLVWYGAYEEYLAVKMLLEHQGDKQKETTTVEVGHPKSAEDEVQISFLGKITSYASDLGNKVAGWFGFGGGLKTA